MKKKLFLLPLLAALALTGCSSDEDLGNGSKEDGNGYGYVAVNIVQPKSVDTRSNDANNFEEGSTAENEAQTGLFFIFNSSGNIVGDSQTVNLSGNNNPTSEPPYVERVYNAVLVIDGAASKPTDAYQIVCVLNAPTGLSTDITKLSDLTEKIDNYAANNTSAGTFIMTNSVYKDNNNKVLGAIVETDKIVESPSKALETPVDVYVERVVAKIRAKSTENFSNNGAKPTIDGTEKQLTIKITGIEVANIAEKSYLFKNIENISYTWSWNDATNKRSYWETVPNINDTEESKKLTFFNQSYNDIVTNSPKEESATDFDISKVTTTNFCKYVQPNTSTKKTAILVTAQLMDGDSPADLAYVNKGFYTTKDGAMNYLLALLKNKGWYKKDGSKPITTLAASDIVWKNNNDEGISVNGLKSYEVVAQLASSVDKIYNSEGTEVSDGVTTVNNYLVSDEAKDYRARIFTDGKCYYFVNIEQTPVAIDNGYNLTDPALEGVIRNHIYDLTLKSIKGIGTPVFDPTDVIIPEKPTDEQTWFLAAQINVLDWRLVKQTIDFE